MTPAKWELAAILESHEVRQQKREECRKIWMKQVSIKMPCDQIYVGERHNWLM